MNIAIIPARGGSKGIKNKNLKQINNESLLSRTIKAAKYSQKINHVYVSSDDQNILNESEKYQAISIKRKKELSLDETSTEPVILDAINQIEREIGEISIIIILQCTSTFTTTNEIDKVVSFLENNNTMHDAAFAASSFHGFIWKYDEESNMAAGINHQHSEPRQRRQDLDLKQYLELGSVYAIKRRAFINSKSRFGNNPKPVEVDSINSYLEIDTLEDLQIARLIAQAKHNL